MVEVKEAMLHEWAVSNAPGDDLMYKKAYWDQIMFVRDRLSVLLSETGSMKYKDIEALRVPAESFVKVISTHWSKSVLLPVYKFSLFSMEVVMRNNFYNWNLTFKLPNFPEMNKTEEWLSSYDKDLCYYYYEGFPDEWVVKTGFDEDQCKFSLVIDGDLELYSLFRLYKHLLMQKLAGKKAIRNA